MPPKRAIPSQATAAAEPPRAATSYDVARAAGVSQSAVSRAFRAGASISDGMRARIEAAAARLGYQPSQVARSLASRRSRIVGVLASDATARNYPELLTELGEEIQAAGHRMLVFTLRDEEAAAGALADILAYGVDGLVSAVPVPRTMLDACAGRDIPVVLYNRPGGHRWPASVGTDHAEGMARLAAHLAAAGHRRAWFLAGPQGHAVSEARLAGLLAALPATGLALAGVTHADFSHEAGQRAAAALPLAAEGVDVLVCANDAMALGALDACRHALRLAVPARLGVTGFDDIPAATWPSYALTTLRQPRAALALAAVDLLIRHLGGRASSGETRLMRAELVVRGTTRPRPG